MNIIELKDRILLNFIEHKVGLVLSEVYEIAGSPTELINWPKEKWLRYFSVQKVNRVFKTILESRIDDEIEYILENNIGVISIDDEIYPNQLKEIYNPPLLLFYLGNLPPNDAVHIAIVGARDSTLAGRCNAEEIGKFLADQGVSVVSGLARGIDSSAHKGALKSENGLTIAVIASGIGEFIKPKLYSFHQEIINKGAIISEFPVKSAAYKKNFPLRNRIITGLCLATIIVEAKERSGSMISARLAAEQGREVFALPGPINSEMSSGTNSLIRTGATLVSKPSDILSDLNLSWQEKEVDELTIEEDYLLPYLTKSPKVIDDIIYKSQRPLSWVLKVLDSLEKKEIIKKVPGNQIIKLID
ncbi:MAG: DNA-protecting protein DprA [Candidatus Cloacimonadota bacterium]|nr:MAG: DNA-protecting protein DprA [Candidatus Cloacimonadota bacterium]